ncbi:MAG: NERD domain-containing protein [Anaerolineales bacterium]|nr:NERD domain-containing protein [Anaerolineales bacterium]
MISIADRPKLKSIATFTNVTAVGGFITLLGGVILPYFKPEFASVAYGFMLGGLIISIIGIYFTNRWVRPPRPETSLDEALRKFPDSYRLYHYSGLPCKHILLTPYGLVLFQAINWDGVFSYKNKRWKEHMNFGRVIRYPLEQHFDDPNKNASLMEQTVREYLKGYMGEYETLPLQSMVVFLHPRVKLEVENPSILVSALDGFKKKIPAKGERMPEALYESIQKALDECYPPAREQKV